MNAIPLLSPLSWKAYFIFLFPSIFMNCLFIFHMSGRISRSLSTTLKASFVTAVVLAVFSSEVFVGRYFSDVMETYSAITVGSMLLIVNLMVVYANYGKYEETTGASIVARDA
jgi:hypothetical protein